VNLLMKELATDRAELRARDARIADLESQVEKYRIQLTTVIARAVTRNRSVARKRVVPRPKPEGASFAKEAGNIEGVSSPSEEVDHGKRR
jgi:hypothetical protein